MKINVNDVTKGFFVVNFHHFANIKKTININKGFHILNLKIYIFLKNDIILQWILGLVIKIFKSIIY